MTLQVEDYNLDHPATLHTVGTLQGRAVHVIASTVTPLASGPASRHFLASLSQPLSARAGQDSAQDRIVIKVVLALLNAYESSTHYSILTPFYPYTLRALLDNPHFVPSSPSYAPFALALSRQLVQALHHLHHNLSLAHRDLNPSNIVIASNGRLKLIDFGCCIPTASSSTSTSDRVVDGPKGLEHDFGTLPYRAPELIFGSNSYDPKGLDRWMLGCTLAEFWTPFEEEPRDEGSDDSDEASNIQDGYWSDPPPPRAEPSFPPISTSSCTNGAQARAPLRQSLFTLPSRNPTDFSLLSSIFSTLGTPTLQTWPEARHLPSFGYFVFQEHPVDQGWVRRRCVFLEEVDEEKRNGLDVLEEVMFGLVRISQRERWSVERCLQGVGRDVVDTEGMIERGELARWLEELMH
ncbi:BQ2448_7304 [Microbotryum intermedium]|uniref:cyclin-dependent kinase n=1 Tax=Microbotryum intermedium TaxID=269621 RepID=A0A238FQ99_9BASI|nr:BQ2448_7304 [Microbotryum intermedium]